ncbi:Protein CBG00128 [Caenorhabditis briggsae]|uniref:Protein CBG00128 n=1 Tax=Caenorhabditis briggsae TaxID=6238 RepID=A8WMC5_CAEBR|nr:Protein CBG00128 [Caenorhabditis briggsae]CAP21629.2 Protein CBG00128 [Caenorhabditis briggsae]
MSSDIPDSDRKLSYDCLKCVTQKFEANFRFRLAEGLPKIQWADKAVPLFISKLTICEEGHKLNDTDYRLGVICHTCNGYAPKTIICGNQYGHLRDIDRFRFEKRLFPEFTPGDIFVQDFNPQRGVDDDLELAITEASFMMEHDRLTALEKLCDSWDVNYIALCREIQNKKIVISLGQQMQPEQYGVLVQNLIDAKGTLGTYYDITQPGEKETRIGMRVISNRYDNAVMGERLVIIPLSHQLQLNVSCEPYLMNPRHHLRTMKIEVVQIQAN